MNKQPHIPDPETSKRLLANLRRSRMEVQEVNLELGEINAMLAEQLREQRLKRVRRSLNNSTAEL
ncbi:MULTISPECIES: hypothetical protein [Planktothrix]|jgi:hypothetical protein|uniref:Uncharacterized protein n=2 Tax=Planktothrix TaxID=54304 RepID=A0A6J7ZFN2_PLARU|nr:MULTISPECIES: hypothetical protein [Planktothrix]CAD5972965.1 hypothetical protein NO108_04282 [Planktothrix rubescens]MBD2480904.1 hypothetical protein [Planktothrix sp. FACHB-1365]MCF3569072.1 hypothetical protein [Planktothrix agardhii 1807]MCF3570570.1 hypothetical protein [Planktothrix agardhii 1805]MCF3586384.1 hypothetical protein [Planktothrix agardhii 1803]